MSTCLYTKHIQCDVSRAHPRASRAFPRRLSWCSGHRRILTAKQKQICDAPTSGSSQIQQAMTQNNKKRQRPCRAKRQRYRKFVNKLKAEIVADPSSFEMCQVELLPSLIDHPERLHKLTLYLESFQEQVGGTLNA